jgi:hypothetical protein
MIGRARRRRAPADSAGSIEFAELLDPIFAPDAPRVHEPVEPIEAIRQVDEPEAALTPAQSRFADAVLDDDRLPLGKAKRRWLRR